MFLIKQLMINYLDPRNLAVFAMIYPDLKLDALHQLKTRFDLDPVSLHSFSGFLHKNDLFLFKYDSQLQVTYKNTIITFCIDAKEKALKATYIDHVEDMICLVNLLHETILEVMSGDMSITLSPTYTVTTPHIHKVTLHNSARIAIPISNMKQIERDNICEIGTLQDEFIILQC